MAFLPTAADQRASKSASSNVACNDDATKRAQGKVLEGKSILLNHGGRSVQELKEIFDVKLSFSAEKSTLTDSEGSSKSTSNSSLQQKMTDEEQTPEDTSKSSQLDGAKRSRKLSMPFINWRGLQEIKQGDSHRVEKEPGRHVLRKMPSEGDHQTTSAVSSSENFSEAKTPATVPSNDKDSGIQSGQSCPSIPEMPSQLKESLTTKKVEILQPEVVTSPISMISSSSSSGESGRKEIWEITDPDELQARIFNRKIELRAAAVEKLRKLSEKDRKMFIFEGNDVSTPSNSTGSTKSSGSAPACTSTGFSPYPAYLGPYTPMSEDAETDRRKRTVLIFERTATENNSPTPFHNPSRNHRLQVFPQDSLREMAHEFTEVLALQKLEKRRAAQAAEIQK